MTDWDSLKDDRSPRGYTGQAGVSVRELPIQGETRGHVLSWAGAPDRPVRCQVLVAPSQRADESTQGVAFDSEENFATLVYSIGMARYEAQVDVGAGRPFGVTCSQLDLYVTAGADDLLIEASIVPHVPEAPRPRRSIMTEVLAAGFTTINVPRQTSWIDLFGAPNALVEIAFLDAQGVAFPPYVWDPSLGIAPRLVVPNGARQIVFPGVGAAYEVGIVCELGI